MPGYSQNGKNEKHKVYFFTIRVHKSEGKMTNYDLIHGGREYSAQ
jgi:hypothetical protein